MTDLDDLRYPIGRFSAPASSLAGIRAAQIHTVRLLPERLRAAGFGEAVFTSRHINFAGIHKLLPEVPGAILHSLKKLVMQVAIL